MGPSRRLPERRDVRSPNAQGPEWSPADPAARFRSLARPKPHDVSHLELIGWDLATVPKRFGHARADEVPSSGRVLGIDDGEPVGDRQGSCRYECPRRASAW